MNRHLSQRLGFSLLTLIALFTVVPIVGVIVYIFIQGSPAVSWEFLSAVPRSGMREGGILPAIIGTFYLTVGTAIFSVPLGIAAAIYLSEYAADNSWTRLIRLAIINLAGIPSVVYGLFGLGTVRAIPELRHQHPGRFPDVIHHDSCPSSSAPRRKRYGPCRRLSARSAFRWAPPAGRPSAASYCPRLCPAS